VALAAGCASYSGGGLVAGRSTTADVRAQMGKPDARVALANGDVEWFYARMPWGRQTYAVTISPQGVVKSVEQRLTEKDVAKIRVGTSTEADVRALLGPPYLVSHLALKPREVWQYTMYNAIQDEYNLFIQFSPDGVVREVLMLRDFRDAPGRWYRLAAAPTRSARRGSRSA